jgi:hypothetical protein
LNLRDLATLHHPIQDALAFVGQFCCRHIILLKYPF